MISAKNILTVARFEIKTLFRSWFFRILSGMSIFILFWMNFGLLTSVGDAPWGFRGISACVPYMNLLLLNVTQAVIAVFLASDFLKRDKKLDTTEVIYMRSMTNGDYVLGKTLGILSLFGVLNAIVLGIAAIFHMFFSDAVFSLDVYLIYPLIISFPTLIFILGLSFLFMILIRNQPVTFIILLGYIATTLFVLGKKLYHVFDYMAYYVPMMYSEFVGFGDLISLLIHRGMYLLFGIGFIFATILMLKRLPQSRGMQTLSLILTIVCVGSGLFLGRTYLSRFARTRQLREQMRELNNEWISSPLLSTDRMDIQVIHGIEGIEATSQIHFTNRTGSEIDQFIFRLNPELNIEKVTARGQELTHRRDLHLLFVENGTVQPNMKDSLTIHYSGQINDQACYLDVNESDREKLFRLFMFIIGKRQAFVTSDYLLLTPESMWYPQVGVGYAPSQPKMEREFIHFSLKVETSPDLMVISQGQVFDHGEGHFEFETEFPLPQLSLAIGNYEKHVLDVDSVAYQLYHLKGHDYYAQHLDQISDTLDVIIRDIKQDFENTLELTYPYKRFSLVEVPVQFTAYPRLWTEAMETVQPEIVFMPENGVTMDRADFRDNIDGEKRRAERSNQVISDTEIQARAFRRFVNSTLVRDMASFRRNRNDEDISLQISYTIYPNYFTYVNYLQSDKWPMLHIAMESFISKRMDSPVGQFRRMWSGLTEDERVNLALAEKNMTEIMTESEDPNFLSDVLRAKGNYLFTQLQSEMGEDEFTAFMNRTMIENRFQPLRDDAFIRSLRDEYQIDFEKKIDRWMTGKDLPGFIISGIDGYQVLDDDRTRHQVRFKVTNEEAAPGLLKVTFRAGGPGGRGGRFGGGDDEGVVRMITLGPRETKEIGVVLDAAPRMMSVNTLISKNLPSEVNRMFEEFELRRRALPFDGERILDSPVRLFEKNEIIVDNEDPGFKHFSPTIQSPLKKLLRITHEPEDEYSGIRFWRPPTKWTATTHSDFYGSIVRSAYYTRSGSGDRKAVWETPISESGFYDVYTHHADISPPWRRRRQQNNGQYHFIIHHGEGTDEALLDRDNAVKGWNFLGTYYFNRDTAKVELTNESKGRSVLADAIKWVKH